MCSRTVGIFRTYSTHKTAFYITTPIYYVNATPHIGHVYTSAIADAIQRWQHLIKPHTAIKFATGTDEHGTKIQQAAAKNNSTVEAYCDTIAEKYKVMSDTFDVAYTEFIRTTDDKHTRAVQQFWKTIEKNGHIYKSKYGGWYCVSDETFLTDIQLKEQILPDGRKIVTSSESGHPAEWTEEDNYMFRLSTFQDDLVYWLTRSGDVVKPKKFQKILLDMINEGLSDVSVSRPSTRVHWGIKVPGDDTQTVYVWLDALVNYLTVASYPQSESQQFLSMWPPDVHVIGKDILRFHGIYWPAFLMAANLEPPKSILCHSHWMVDGEKMSKSKNNVVCPFNRSETYTTDGFRYFLLREGVPHSDGNYSDTKVIRILNSELADTLGNLLSRCCGASLNPNQTFPGIDPIAFESVASKDVTKKLIASVIALPDETYQHYKDFNFYKTVDSVIATLHIANLFFETLKPWEIKKDPVLEKELDVVLHITMETLRICAVILQPIIPRLAQNILDKLTVPTASRFWDSLCSLSWNDSNFLGKKLSTEKSIIFRRIIIESKKTKLKNN